MRRSIYAIMHPITYIRKHIFSVTQDAFAEIAGTTQASVSRWESGRLYPNQGELARIRRAARERGIPWNDRWFFELPIEVA
jgi:DNA-binding transcriptional regulator YiaG